MDSVLQELLDQRTWVEGLCNALVRDRSQAEDLAQETMASAMQTKGPIANVRAYLRRVAENHALQRLRKELRHQRRERAVAAANSDRTASSAHEVNEAFEVQREVARAVHGLAEPFRSTVLLHHFEGQSLAEIARRQQTPEGTVRWRLFRAHALLREELRGTYGRDWKLALLPLCTPGLSRSAAAMTAVLAAMLLVGGAFLAWPDRGAVAVEAATADPVAADGAPEEPAAPDGGVVTRTSFPRPGVPSGAAASAPAASAAGDEHALVRVRVLDQQGQPIDGASLRFDRLVQNGFEMRSPLQALLLPEAKAGADGRAALPMRTDERMLGDLPQSMRPARGEPWQLAFAVRANGYLPTQRTIFVADGDDADLGDVRLQRAAVLRGRVVDKDGSAIGGARVGVFAPPLPLHLSTMQTSKYDLDSALASAETASMFGRGRYELTPSPHGPVMLVAMAEGYRTSSLFVDVLGDEQDVADLVLDAATTATSGKGIVVQVVDEHGSPVSGALVHRVQQHGSAAGSSGPDGMVRFGATSRDGEPDLSPATVIASDQTGRLQATVKEGVVPNGELVTVTLRTGRAVEVIVRSPRSAKGDLRVDWAATDGSPAAIWLQTDGDRVRFVPPPFRARLRVARDRCVTWVSEPIEPDAWGERMEVELRERTALIGSVQANGVAVAGARVLALTRGKQVMRDGYRMGEWAATGRFHAQTDEKGEFALSRDEKGELRLLVSKDGYAPAVSEPFVFDPAGSAQVPAIELTNGGAVRGVLRRRDGKPVARVWVALHHPVFGPRTMLTARDGTFAFEHVAAGGYEVREGDRPATGGWSESPLGEEAQLPFAVDAVVREGETTQLEIVRDACVLAVQVAAVGSLRLSGWTIELRAAVDGREVEAARPLPVDGKVEFATARPGDHDVVLRAPGGPFGEVTVRVRVALVAGQNERSFALELAPWRSNVNGLGDAKKVKLVRSSDGVRVESWANVDAAKAQVECVLAPVGEVEIVRGQETVLRVDTRVGR